MAALSRPNLATSDAQNGWNAGQQCAATQQTASNMQETLIKQQRKRIAIIGMCTVRV